MDKPISGKDEKRLIESLDKAEEMHRRMEMKEEEKRWADIDLSLALGAGLERLTKDELSAIRSNLGIRGASTLKKQELIGALEKHIPEALPYLLSRMDETRYKILKQIADRGGHAFVQLEPYQLSYFRKRGLLFTGTFKGKRTLVMSQEVLASFGRIDPASMREKIRRNTEWIKLTHGMLYYYGTLDLEHLESMLAQHTGEKPDLYAYMVVMEEAEKFYQLIHHDNERYSHADVFDIARLKREQAMRSSLPFYPFTKGQLLRAGESGFADRNPSYRAFVDFIARTYDISRNEADDLVEECEYAIQCGDMPGDVLTLLQEQLEMDDLKTVEAFMEHIVALHNNTKQWILKGYAPYEISAERNRTAAPPSPAEGNVIDFATRKTVGRNDPCPCGSGLKYKKCCGK
ncbi:SEC-C metal-binding domain-containing protein [Gordoniibacillus kamchatkensis]|uniref:SEC-C metal-binding domain-containing protein n=1 Tax=Gordoniibacillus kamchatkensis TaxID=1590651 RepID=UPI00069863C0|nr:SEC-C metal-binding domain-containing protein [Paenibacillus sp. VKM B-2647]